MTIVRRRTLDAFLRIFHKDWSTTMAHGPSTISETQTWQAQRGIFCNRTLNLRGIRAVGYDMDYTLVQYQAEAWEEAAYGYVKRSLLERGWPVAGLTFDPTLVMRGLVVDRELGNVVKTNRFGFVKRATHGTHQMDFLQQRRVYARVLVELREKRWFFLNTLFSLSQGCMFLQLVDLLDAGVLPPGTSYDSLFSTVCQVLDQTHLEGSLKQDVLNDPAVFIESDPDTAQALLDQKAAGKKLMLITNSEWPYTQAVMGHTFDPHLPHGWRELFDLIIVLARKPSFFQYRMPAFEIIDEQGRLQPVMGDLELGKCYVGGDAQMVEKTLRLRGEQILFVGDHLFADVHVSKEMLRWRTALILRELEDEIDETLGFRDAQRQLHDLMAQKQDLERDLNVVRLGLLRLSQGCGPVPEDGVAALKERRDALGQQIKVLDARIGPLAEAQDGLLNPRWGLLLRAGNDKSLFTRQVESYADIYMSRVSNLVAATPYAYLRSERSSIPHDVSLAQRS